MNPEYYIDPTSVGGYSDTALQAMSQLLGDPGRAARAGQVMDMREFERLQGRVTPTKKKRSAYNPFDVLAQLLGNQQQMQ